MLALQHSRPHQQSLASGKVEASSSKPHGLVEASKNRLDTSIKQSIDSVVALGAQILVCRAALGALERNSGHDLTGRRILSTVGLAIAAFAANTNARQQNAALVLKDAPL